MGSPVAHYLQISPSLPLAAVIGLAANARRHRSLARSGLLSSCFILTGSCWSKPFQEWKEVLHFWVAASNDPRMGLLFPSPVGGLFFMFEPSLGMGHPMEQSMEIALYN
jgi:hypothetical protein